MKMATLKSIDAQLLHTQTDSKADASSARCWRLTTKVTKQY